MKKFAFICPGQGSHSVGMLNMFSDLDIVRYTIQEASDTLNIDIWKLIADGPPDKLNMSINTQPSILTASIACQRAWIYAGGTIPSIIAGHSLGEYTALVMADALKFCDALRLVRFRAKAMQTAVPPGKGGMAAILGLNDNVVCMVCKEASQVGVVEAVNFNAPKQIVIAGHNLAVKNACKIAKAKGARSVILPVSVPFHSSLMKPVLDKLRNYFAGVDIQIPKIAVVNNIDVESPSDPVAIKDALIRQVSGPVHWIDCVRYIANTGVTHMIECGPGRVLTGLIKRIDSKLESLSISDPESISKAINLISS
ncbi:MAG: ACP S-malonyltransferase [Burkholderia sp.]|nr:ACP S-malonyltransferase [Burkholderia sp.]